MHFIKKLDAPDFFVEAAAGKTRWNEYGSGKERLRQHILDNEQHSLCVYCERTVTAKRGVSHVEHVKPKETYPELTFDYSNLAVSCEGSQVNPEDANDADSKGHNCGHKKANEYNEALFLNPLELQSISDYFVYERQSQSIEAAQPSYQSQVEYTVSVLRLNEPNLRIARKNAVMTFRKALTQLASAEQRKQAIARYLRDDHKPFISCLRYNFGRLVS